MVGSKANVRSRRSSGPGAAPPSRRQQVSSRRGRRLARPGWAACCLSIWYRTTPVSASTSSVEPARLAHPASSGRVGGWTSLMTHWTAGRRPLPVRWRGWNGLHLERLAQVDRPEPPGDLEIGQVPLQLDLRLLQHVPELASVGGQVPVRVASRRLLTKGTSASAPGCSSRVRARAA